MTLKNIAASVRARLMKRSKETERPFQEQLQYYGLERFLYRFTRSEYRGLFVLKGALMLRVWNAPFARPTRDIDLLGYVDNSVENLENIVRSICAVDVDDDGMVFDADSVGGERIKEDADYEGVRIKFVGFLEKVKVPMQIDIGFGDVVYPPAQELEYPPLLEFAAPSLRVYPRETVIAEKFQAMVYLGSLNSRMKDFYDIWLLARMFNFDGRTLKTAIINTFKNRQTEFDNNPVALSNAFAQADTTQKQWTAFVRKGLLGEAPKQFQETAEIIREFLLPVVYSIVDGNAFNFYWTAPGPWNPMK